MEGFAEEKAPTAAAQVEPAEPDEAQDALGSYEEAAIKKFKADKQFLDRLRKSGMPWRGVQERLKEALPDVLSDRDQIAYGLVSKAMAATFGQQNNAWRTEKRPSRGGRGFTTWIVLMDGQSAGA